MIEVIDIDGDIYNFFIWGGGCHYLCITAFFGLYRAFISQMKELYEITNKVYDIV